MTRKPLGGPPIGLAVKTEANKEDINERQTGVELHQKISEVNCIITTPNPEIATDYLKQDLILLVETSW